jgi:hypothetical protein
MRIDNSAVDLSQAIGQTADPNAPTGKTLQAHRDGADQVQISDMAAQLSTDPSKLARLQASVSARTYSVGAAQIAGSIMQEMMQG